MSFRFRKSFKLFPGVRLNIGKRGPSSVSVGKRGASVSFGKRGTYGNVGVPGTGMSYRQRLDSDSSSQRSSFATMFAVGFFLALLAIGGLLLIGIILVFVSK